ncbi:MAG TPA: phosphatase PAP2 family protein [Ghiorsea sp.]|nr:phosphatase PAP2 family protein [Ghiorsea sp.]HIP06652.1 phosphatase PAP2 family protein [Mariprofundaceae bacterium]
MFRLTLISLVLSCCLSNQARAASDIEVAGDWIQILIPSIAYSTTLYLDDEEGEKQMYQSFFTNTGITFALKFTVGRERPDGSNNRSFPSGHTSAAFQGASFIHARYGWEYAIPAYIGASFVGYSRVYANKHFTSDVLAGAVIGTISSFYFATPYKGVSISPTANNGQYGLQVNTTW